ncbi:hypothetical protein, partial [Nocardia sp. NPDC058497]|uniref:hypothetical protein n=1 Tax=Nocardia sp. NPDC058497 TaxID=3346529 RepID=UPI00364612DB
MTSMHSSCWERAVRVLESVRVVGDHTATEIGVEAGDPAAGAVGGAAPTVIADRAGVAFLVGCRPLAARAGLRVSTPSSRTLQQEIIASEDITRRVSAIAPHIDENELSVVCCLGIDLCTPGHLVYSIESGNVGLDSHPVRRRELPFGDYSVGKFG